MRRPEVLPPPPNRTSPSNGNSPETTAPPSTRPTLSAATVTLKSTSQETTYSQPLVTADTAWLAAIGPPRAVTLFLYLRGGRLDAGRSPNKAPDNGDGNLTGPTIACCQKNRRSRWRIQADPLK